MLTKQISGSIVGGIRARKVLEHCVLHFAVPFLLKCHVAESRRSSGKGYQHQL